MSQFQPFDNESQVMRIGDLEIENREDRIEIFGSMVVTKDKAGLQAAKELQSFLADVITKLKSETLPDNISIEAPTTIKNPLL